MASGLGGSRATVDRLKASLLVDALRALRNHQTMRRFVPRLKHRPGEWMLVASVVTSTLYSACGSDDNTTNIVNTPDGGTDASAAGGDQSTGGKGTGGSTGSHAGTTSSGGSHGGSAGAGGTVSSGGSEAAGTTSTTDSGAGGTTMDSGSTGKDGAPDDAMTSNAN
jgi:hypothetical protein